MEEADIEAAAAAPAPAPTAVTAAEALLLFLAATAKPVVLGFSCAIWVNYCAFTASLMGCVQGAALVKAAFVGVGLLCLAVFAVCSVAVVGLILLFSFVALLLLLFWCRGRRTAEAGETDADGGSRMPAAHPPGTESAGALGLQEAFDRGDLVVLLLTLAVDLLLMLLPATNCFEDGVCSRPMEIRCFPNSVALLLRYLTNSFGPTKR